MRLGLSLSTARGALNAEPQRFFQPQDKGLILDASRLDQLFQDAAGTTPANTPGQPVGLVRDLSGGERTVSQATSAARPTYRVDAGGRPYLEFDGVDDLLGTAAFNWGSDEVTVVVAIQKGSDASVGNVVSFGDFSAAGCWRVLAPATAGAGDIGAFSGAGTNVFLTNTGNAAPVPVVISTQAKTQQPMVRLRRNGVQVAESLAGQGATSTYGAGSPYTLRIGRWFGTESFSGRIYALVAINRLLSPAELARAEAWMAAKCGVVL